MLCKKCGNNVKSDFKYCPYCGERIVSDFHDHYEELTPPFLVREPDEPDAAADWYAAAPGERAPDFALPPTAAPEEPPLAPGAFPQEDLEDDLAPPHFRVSLPEEPAPGGYGGPLFGADGPPASGRYAAPAGFEPVDDPAGPSEAPYFVYRPEPAARIPGTEPAGETPSAPPAREIPRRGADKPKAGPGIVVKLLIIVGVLIAAGAASWFGYRLLGGGPAPFRNTDFSAMFARVYGL